MGFATYDETRLAPWRQLAGPAGVVPLGDQVSDVMLLKGRISTGSIAGTALVLDSSYLYSEGLELRYKVTDWTNIGSSFSSLYLRAEAGVASGSQGIRALECYSIANATFSVSSLQCAYFEIGIKASGAQTITGGHAIEGSIAPYGGTGAITITNSLSCLLLTPSGVSSRIDTANAAKIHGIRLLARDGDGGSTKLGHGLYMVNDTGQSGTRSLTSGVTLDIGCTTGFKITAAAAALTTKGIFIGEDSDSAQSGIPLLGASWGTAQGNGFYCDDDGVALVGYTEAMTVRMLTTAAVSTGDVSTVALHPDLTLNANYTGSGGLSSIWGNTTIKSGKTINTSSGLGDVGGATFGLDVVGVLASNSHGCGVSVGLGGSGTKSGIVTAFRVRTPTGTVLWDGFASIPSDGTTLAAITTAAASQTATMTNSPKSGNPAYWLTIYVGTTKHCFPVWASA